MTMSLNTTQTLQPQSSAMLVQLTTDGVPKLYCPVCNKALVSLNGYVKHLKKHEPPGGFLCSYCDARYCSEEDLKRHLDEQHTIIACRICKDITFSQVDDYRAHIRDVHNGIDREMFICDKCGAEYKTVEPYKRHMDTQCGTIKPHKCDQCDMSFVTKYNLKHHKETHSGVRRYCCSYCGKNFLQKGRLVEHERSHTGEKPYKCDVCGKSFAHRESIVTHSSIHTGVRLVECPCCLARFSCYSNLIKHRRTRPDTCGLPQYDPPKNRVRTHKPRIPPTLNPTSEIKVSGFNKIIKPDEKKIQREPKRKNTNEPKTSGKKTGSRPGRRAKKRRDETEDSETEADEEALCNGEKSLVSAPLTAAKSRLRSSTRNLLQKITIEPVDASMLLVPKQEENTTLNGSDTEEDYPDFDPAESESDDDNKEFLSLLPIKNEYLDCGDKDQEANNQEMNSRINDLEFCEEQHIVPSFFTDKDQLLECLLKEDSNDKKANVKDEKHKHHNKLKEEQHILNETEVVFIKDEVSAPYALEEVDMLDVKITLKDDNEICDVEDPETIEQESVIVSRTGNLKLRIKQHQVKESAQIESGKQPQEKAPPPTRGKYRKRNDKVGPKTQPGRMAKITQQQLKERLKMLKQDEKAWHCPYCIKVYYMRKPFEKHLRDDHKCPEDEIKKSMKNDDGLANDEVFQCKVCNKIYLVEKRLIAHMKLHGPDGNLIFKCPCYCSQFFATKEEAVAHAQLQHRDLIYCNICEKFMTGHDSLKNHMRTIHQTSNKSEGGRAAKRNLVCDKCGKKFYGRTSLTDHVRSDCGRKPLYQCTVCGKHLTTAGILKTHLLLHKDETPYQCDQCGKTFKVKAQYKTHIKTRHTDYKPFKCHLCPKAYPYRESLLTHMTVHTGIKRFLCNGCGKRFTCISNLQAHRKVLAETCGLLPLNAKATQYMGVQKGNLLLGAKPEAGVDYKETNTLLAKEVIDRDLPVAQEFNYPSEPSAPLATVPLNCTQATAQQLLMPQIATPPFTEDSHSHASAFN